MMEMPEGWHKLRAYTEEIRGTEYPIDINIEASELMKEMANALEKSRCQGCMILTSDPPIPQDCARCAALKKFRSWK